MSAVSTILLGRRCPNMVSPFGVDLDVCGLGLVKKGLVHTSLACTRPTQ